MERGVQPVVTPQIQEGQSGFSHKTPAVNPPQVLQGPMDFDQPVHSLGLIKAEFQAEMRVIAVVPGQKRAACSFQCG